MKTVVYVEESENALADALIKRKDIALYELPLLFAETSCGNRTPSLL